MKFEVICDKLRFYVRWYQSMTLAERNSAIGIWVRDRINIFTEIIVEFEKSVSRSSVGAGNYKSNFKT